jgi:transcriptional regulator of acetoin/glycerol metabolism
MRVSVEWDKPTNSIAAGIVDPASQRDPDASSLLTDFAEQIEKRCTSGDVRLEKLRNGSQIPVFNNDGHLRTLSEIEADIIRLGLKVYNGNITAIAHHLGVGRSTIYRKAQALIIGKPSCWHVPAKEPVTQT